MNDIDYMNEADQINSKLNSALSEAIEAVCTLRQMRIYMYEKMRGESCSPSKELINKLGITSYPEIWMALEKYKPE